MAWFYVLVLFSAVATVMAINRPVYKIVLTQKGYAQFLRYDIETPPLSEFTFCSWFRIYDFNNDQSLFTYIINGNNRVIRMWLDSKERQINVSIDEKVTSSAPLVIMRDVWRHVCLSYQSDYGAWAVYVDSRLISCQASQSLFGYILPGGGSVIVGYGTDTNGAQNGLEGEVFGANMILRSTIERNYTIRTDPKFEQKSFHKNRLKLDGKNSKYIVLSDLLTDEINNNFETTGVPNTSPIQFTKNFIRLKTPHSLIEHEVGTDFRSSPGTTSYLLNDKDLVAYVSDINKTQQPTNKVRESKFENLPTLSEIELPPPLPTFSTYDKLTKNFAVNLPRSFEYSYDVSESSTECKNCTSTKKYPEELYEVEMPPPVEKNSKVYGQWTSSRFAGNVFNYLKSMNLRTREQKKVIPQTIPLPKISDSFPYPSDFKVLKVRPLMQFQRKSLVEKQSFDTKRMPHINLQILEEDLRNNIMKYHSQTVPKNVEITNRGKSKKRPEHRFSRDVNNQKSSDSYENTKNIFRPKSLQLLKTKKYPSDLTLHNQYLMSILPFLKSLEYFMGDSHDLETRTEQEVTKNDDIYTRSLSSGNKWHNVKSYSNDYTPREIKVGFDDKHRSMDEKIAAANKKNPGIRLRYRHKNRMVKDIDTLQKGRQLALEVSNQADYNRDSVAIFKYKGRFTPEKKAEYTEPDMDNKFKLNHKKSEKSNFNQQVKIGNALNERPVIGNNVEQNKRSFVGGDESIPDINKYRSESEPPGDNVSIPNSLGPRICKNLELYDRVLYVQPDESIDMTHIMSPVRMKNIGIEFIMQNYKKCSLQESNLQSNTMLFIDWSKTPVRLFGGAYPRKTTDLCGFF